MQPNVQREPQPRPLHDLQAEPFAAEPALRIAVVTETWPPEVNGVATTVAKLVEGLLERGHHVELVRPRQREREVGMLTARLAERLVKSWPLPRYPGLRMGMPCGGRLLTQWRREPRSRPDLVHIATEGPLGWSAWWAARRLKIATTSDFRTNFHTYVEHYGLPWLARPTLALLRAFHNRCGATMVPTEAMRRTLAAAGFERLHVVGRGVDTGLFTPSRRSAALRASWGAAGEDALVLACVGRLAAEKNLDAVLAAYEAVRRERPCAKLLFVGDGPLREALAARCPEAIFAGHRSGEDLAAHYASADLFLFASRTETFGNVTTEAMACALPVLAFDHAAAGQLITSGHNGVLVRGAAGAGDAAFVRAALAMAADADGRHAMGEAARATACRIGWPRIVEQFEAVAARVMVEASPPTPQEGDDRWTSWSRSPNSSSVTATFDTRASVKSR